MKTITHPSVSIREIDCYTYIPPEPLKIEDVQGMLKNAVGTQQSNAMISPTHDPSINFIHAGNWKKVEPKIDSTLSFSNNNGHVGTVTWDEGGVKFEGDINDCAKILFCRVNDLMDHQLMTQSVKHEEDLRAVTSDCLIKMGNMQNTLDEIDNDHALKLKHVVDLMEKRHAEEIEAKALELIQNEATDAIQCMVARKSVDAIRAFSDEELAHFRVNRVKPTMSATNLPTLF